MLLRAGWVVAIALSALVLGTSFAHVLGRRPKMRYDAELYLHLQTSLDVQWGPPAVGGFVEPAAVLAAVTARGSAVIVIVTPASAPAGWRPPSTSARRAKKAMISSGALPKVTFSRPPMPGPDRLGLGY